MIRVAALTQGRDVPSARFRVRQNIAELQRLGIGVSEYFPEIDVYQGISPSLYRWPRLFRFPVVSAWQGVKVGSRIPHIYRAREFDVTWLQRELLPGYVTLERMLKRPLVFDVDDAIWLSRDGAAASKVSKIASLATVVIAGNKHIADWFSFFNDNVAIIPTAVDTTRFAPSRSTARRDFTIGWVGTKSNIPYLEHVAPALNAIFKRIDDAVLLVVSDSPPKMPGISEKRIRYIPWSESGEVDAINEIDVGIMPLSDNEWSKGKCSFKMLQYMACSIPVVVTPVGMNLEVLANDDVGLCASSQEEWASALEYLYENRSIAREMGARGREVVIQHYSTEVVSKKIAEVFKFIG